MSVGAPNSGTEVIADRILEAAGIDPKKGIKRQGLGVEESVQAMKDGSIDALFWSGGLPTGAITDLTTSDDIVLLDTTKYTDKLKQEYGEVCYILKQNLPLRICTVLEGFTYFATAYNSSLNSKDGQTTFFKLLFLRSFIR